MFEKIHYPERVNKKSPQFDLSFRKNRKFAYVGLILQAKTDPTSDHIMILSKTLRKIYSAGNFQKFRLIRSLETDKNTPNRTIK